MVITDEILICAIAIPGEVEVVTTRTRGRVVSVVLGGQLDGEEYDWPADPQAQNDRACNLARDTNRR